MPTSTQPQHSRWFIWSILLAHVGCGDADDTPATVTSADGSAGEGSAADTTDTTSTATTASTGTSTETTDPSTSTSDMASSSSAGEIDCEPLVDPTGEGAGIHFDTGGSVHVKIIEVMAEDAVKFTLQNDLGLPEIDLVGGVGSEHTFPVPVKLHICSNEPDSGGGCSSTPTWSQGLAQFTSSGGYVGVLEITCT